MLDKKFRKYLVNLGLLTVIVLVLSILFKIFAPEEYVSKAIYFFAPFFSILSIAGRFVFEYLKHIKSKWFSYAILVIRLAKFLIYIAVVLVYALNFQEDAVNFILTFFVFYLIYTYFDIRNMYSSLRIEG